MKIRNYFPAFALAALLFSSCGNDGGKTEPDPSPATLAPQKRPAAPKLAKLTEYKISAEDTNGYVYKVSTFNEAGLEAESKEFGAGGQDVVMNHIVKTYNANGHLSAVKIEDVQMGNTEEKVTCDEKGRKIKVVTSRSDGYKGTDEYAYDEHGNQYLWTNYQNGKHFETYKDYFTYDAQGRKVHERSVYADPEGKKADIVRAIVRYEYKGTDTIPSGEFHYDQDSVLEWHVLRETKGQVVLEKHFNGEELESQSEYTYNAFGEVVQEKSMSPEGELWYTNIYRYDAYGRRVFHLYQHTDGESWGAKFEVEYR